MKMKRNGKERNEVCVYTVSKHQQTALIHFNVFHTCDTEYEDLLDEYYEVLQENFGIEITVN